MRSWLLAGSGVWSSVSEIPSSTDAIDRRFEPVISAAERQERTDRWAKAVEALFGLWMGEPVSEARDRAANGCG